MAADYGPIVDGAAHEWNVDPSLLRALIQQESGWDPKAVSKAGARGLTGIMPDTANGLGLTDLSDPTQQIYGGAKYLAEGLDKEGSPEKALLYYHGGPDWRSKYGPESAAYVPAVTAKYQAITTQATPAAPAVPTPDDPFTAALKSAQQPAAPAANDPFSDALTAAQKAATPATPAQVEPTPMSPNEYGITDDPQQFNKQAPGLSLSLPKTADEARALLAEKPGYTASNILPLRVKNDANGQPDPSQGIEWDAGPLRSIGNAAIDLMDGPRTGIVTPAGSQLLFGAMTGGALAPSLARGTGAAIADTAAYGRPVAQLYDRPGANPLAPAPTAASPAPIAGPSPLSAGASPVNPLAADVMQPPGSLPSSVTAAARTTAQIQREDGVGYNQAVLTQKAEQASAATPAPQSVGAAASRDMTAPEAMPPETPEQKMTNLGKSVTQSAEDRAGPQLVDNTVYVPGVERPLAAREFTPQNSLDDKTLRATDPAYRAEQEKIERNNNQVMADLLGGDAGDANALKAAHDDRAEVAPPAQQLFSNEKPVDASPLIQQIDSTLAGPDGKRAAVVRTLTAVKNSLFDADGNLETLPSQLYGARKNITDLLKKGVGDGADDVRASKPILAGLLDKMDPIINDGAPKYQAYLDQFHEASQPINQMEFLQKYQTGSKKLTNTDGYLQLNKVQKMLDDVYQGQKASGINSAKSLTDDQVQNIVNVRNELQAQSLKDRLAKVKGSDTTQQTNRTGILGEGPLGTAVRGGAELAAHGVLLHTTGGIGNALLALHKNVVKPARAAARAAQQENTLVARKAELLRTEPSNPLASP